MTVRTLPDAVRNGQVREAVQVTHDESTFYANDGKSFFWMENGKKKILPKSKGQSIMISGFMCPCHGFSSGQVGGEGEVINTYTVFYAGKAREGWFTNDDLVKQFKRCALLLRQLHPDADIFVFFDNSMTHRARAPDGLDASKLNLSDGGKNVQKQRDGWYMTANAEGGEVKVAHPMQTGAGVQKGMLTILWERGRHLNDTGRLLCKLCKPCANKTPHAERPNQTPRCCAYHVLSEEADFREQRPWLQEEVEGVEGFAIMFYPKYHCELNWIEMICGWVKSYHRRTCTYSYADLNGAAGLRHTLMQRIPLAFVRRAARHCLRYMNHYRAGLEGPLLEFAVKTYKTHRAVTAEQAGDIKAAFEAYMTSDARRRGRLH
jgi:hypothetical protein